MIVLDWREDTPRLLELKYSIKPLPFYRYITQIEESYYSQNCEFAKRVPSKRKHLFP